MEFNKAYNTKRVQIEFGEETMTEQHHAKACDINGILEKYQRTGVLEHRNEHRGEYAFVDGTTFQECMNVVAKANSMFEELPAKVRQEIGSPKAFLEFVQNPANAKKMVEMGLATSREDIPSMTVQKDKADLEYKESPPNPDGGKPKNKE